jgi:hypothetical protein
MLNFAFIELTTSLMLHQAIPSQFFELLCFTMERASHNTKALQSELGFY